MTHTSQAQEHSQDKPDTATFSERRSLPCGAECLDDGVHFRIGAPSRERVRVVFHDGDRPDLDLERGADGYFTGFVPGVGAGLRYRLRVGDEDPVPDPWSRFQPDGPHGWSEVVDPSSFKWSDKEWTGPRREHQVLYEMHVGTYTRNGTWSSAADHLPYLSELGITTIELMPVAEFPGRFGWGYDGVHLFAPFHHYGPPDEMRFFVNRAHALGMGVVLDVVYNHLGPDGNYLSRFLDHVESEIHSEWGARLNFDGPGCDAVRELVLSNAAYWVREFHIDGLRVDATQDIHDRTTPHILTEITREVRRAAQGRGTIVIAENEPQDSMLMRPEAGGGHGMDMMWNDDFHHSVIVALTGRREAYLSDYDGTARELGNAARWGFLYQGQWYDWQEQPRGKPALDLEPLQFVNFMENHDQVSNLAQGRRVHQLSMPSRWRAVTSLFLLAPGTPMIFQGQEFATSSPFLYFADHGGELAEIVDQGRRKFLSQFPRVQAEYKEYIARPDEVETFARCVLNHDERDINADAVALHRDLLALRRSDPTLSSGIRPECSSFGDDLLVLRWIAGGLSDRLLVVNLGRTRRLTAPSDPLLAPPGGAAWSVRWASDHPTYGGEGTPPLTDRPLGPWTVPAESALFLVPRELTSADEAGVESRAGDADDRGVENPPAGSA